MVCCGGWYNIEFLQAVLRCAAGLGLGDFCWVCCLIVVSGLVCVVFPDFVVCGRG